MNEKTLMDIGPVDALLPLLFGVLAGVAGGTFVPMMEFFDTGEALMYWGGYVAIVIIVCNMVYEIYDKGFGGIISGVISSFWWILGMGCAILCLFGCFDEFYFLALWILPSLLIVSCIWFGMILPKHDGFFDDKGPLIWTAMAVGVYIAVRFCLSIFWVILLYGFGSPMDMIGVISQRLLPVGLLGWGISAVEVIILAALAYTSKPTPQTTEEDIETYDY